MADILGEVGQLVGSAVGGATTGGFGSAASGLVELINKFVTDKNAAAQIVAAHEHDSNQYAQQQLALQAAEHQKELDMQQAAHSEETELLKAQAAVDLEEAKSSNFFVAGWRSFSGWAAAITTYGGIWFGMVMLALGRDPVISALVMLMGIPVSLLFGQLGLHTAERKWGVAPDQSPDYHATPLPPPRATLVKK